MFFLLYLLCLVLCHAQKDQQSPYTLKKLIQFPGTQPATQFGIKSDDQLLAAVYETPQQFSNKSKKANLTVYSGQSFEKVIHTYDYNRAPYEHIQLSNSGFYTVESQNFNKYPYRYQKEIPNNIKNSSSMIALDSKTWAYIIVNQTTNCSIIVVESAYKTEVLYIDLHNVTKCEGEGEPGLIKDLSIGLVAFMNYKNVYILEKKNLKNVIQNFTITMYQDYNSTLKGISSFYNAKKNDSTLFIQLNSFANYSIFRFNHKTQKYQSTRKFFQNPATKCQFYDQDTCFSFYQDYLIVNRNLSAQMINSKYQSVDNPFIDLQIYAVSHDQTYLLGYSHNIFDHQYLGDYIKIFKISNNLQFSLYKTFKYQEYIGKGYYLNQAQFIKINNQVILRFTKDQKNNQTNHYISKICKWNPQKETIVCIIIDHQFVSTQFAIAPIAPNSSNYRLIFGLGQSYQKFLLLRSYLLNENLTLQSTLNVSLNFDTPDNGLKTDLKFIHGSQWHNKFAVSFGVFNGYAQDCIIFFQISTDQKNNVIIELKNKTKQLTNYYYSQFKFAYKNMIAVFVRQTNNQPYNCSVKFYDLNYQEIKFLPQIFYYHCDPYYYSNYRFLAQDQLNYVVVERIQEINNAYIMDFYNIESIDMEKQNYTLTKKSMFKHNFDYVYAFEINFATYFFLPKRNIYINYFYYGKYYSLPSLLIYNISAISMEMYHLKYPSQSENIMNFSIDGNQSWKNQQQFAYLSPLSTTGDDFIESISFTINGTLYQILNVSQLAKNPSFQINQSVSVHEHIISSQKPENFINQSRTMLAPTGKHVISLMYTNVQTIAQISEISNNFQTINLWKIQSKTSLINNLDLSSDGIAFILKTNATKLEPFYYSDHAPSYHSDKQAYFQKAYVTNDDQILYTLNSPSSQERIYGFLKSSPLSHDSQQIFNLAQTFEIQSITGSLGKKQSFLIETQDLITEISVTEDWHLKQKKDFNSTLIEMYIVENVQVTQIKLQKFTIQGQKILKQLKKVIRDVSKQCNEIKTKDLNEITIVLRFKDFLMFCLQDLVHCRRHDEIKSDTVFGISQQGGLVGYVSTGQNNTRVVQLIKIEAFDSLIMLQNFTLPQRSYANSSKEFVPLPKQTVFSSINTLYILCQDANNVKNEQNSPQNNSQPAFLQILYKYDRSACGQNMTFNTNYECVCQQNFTSSQIFSNLSQVSTSFSCILCKQNFFYFPQEQKCLCLQSFKFDRVTGSCQCQNGYIYREEGSYECRSHSYIGWIIGGCLLFVVIVGGGIAWWKIRRNRRLAEMKRRLIVQKRRSSATSQLDTSNEQITIPQSEDSQSSRYSRSSGTSSRQSRQSEVIKNSSSGSGVNPVSRIEVEQKHEGSIKMKMNRQNISSRSSRSSIH